ncbi:MAG: PilZ domain-containing protein [Spirochaetia bacterium]|nr:PilZ domain-containing protein [Spirochaetia bacterium]
MSKDDLKRKNPRIKDFSLSNVCFVPAQSSLEMSVINLSTTGMALLQGSQEVKVLKDDLLSGNLIVEDEKIPVVLTVVRVNSDFIGCKFEKGLDLIEHSLKSNFAIELKALQLTNVTSKILAAQKDGTPRWFFDGGLCELYFVENENLIKRYRLSFQGHSLEGGESKRPEYIGAGLSGKLTHEIAEKLKRFIENIEGLANEHKDYFENEIRRLEF